MNQEFENKVVVIAGGVGELGGPVTSGFLARGARVIVPFISEMKLAAFVGQYSMAATAVKFKRVDLTKEAMVDRFVSDLLESDGRIDVLVNLTGGYEPGRPVAESELFEFDRMLSVNFTAIYLLTRKVVPVMEKQGAGSIVNVSSRAGLRAYAGGAAYSIAKSAVLRFTEALAEELKGSGIHANCVLPSTIDTPRNRMEMHEADFNKWVTGADVAEVIFFLASERSRAIQGAAIPVFGQS